MTMFPAHTLVKAGQVIGGAAALITLAAACGSSNSSSTPAGGGGSSKAAVVETHSGPLGTYLTNAAGRSLYMFASDSAGKSTCTAQCLTYWPAMTSSGKTTTSGGAAAGKLGTITLADGSKQVTYDGHPLYYFLDDTSAGDIKGQGSNNFGAKWWLLSPSGAAITGAATPSGGGY